MEGVWQQTHSPDANSSETFIHIHTPTHSPSYLSRAPRRPYFLLSDYLRTCSTQAGILEPPRFPIIPLNQGQASRTKAAFFTRKCPPTEKKDGTADKGESSSTKLCSKNSPTWISSLPHIFVSVSSA
ncbi:hypothetical protein PAMP_015238 [Pampus punctatissimus]